MGKNNIYLEYYTKHNISPVKQDIENIILHYRRREKLYRTLGIPVQLFSKQRILEVGAGSGYNTLAFFKWGAEVDIIEPNPTGLYDMENLFNAYDIPKNYYKIYPTLLEDFQSYKKYNIVIAEGFTQNIPDKQDVIEKLIQLVDRAGIVVITCMDEMGDFVEHIKKIVYLYLAKDIDFLEDKVNFLIKKYPSQFSDLKGMSREHDDWIKDNIFNSVRNNVMGIGEAISYFDESFDVLGTSQAIFTDYSWYKEVDQVNNYEFQYEMKRHNFLFYGAKETILSQDTCEQLHNQIEAIRQLAIAFEESFSESILQEIVRYLHCIMPVSKKIDYKFYEFITETIEILDHLFSSDLDLNKYKRFLKAFGRSQQYLSMIKKMQY